MLIYQNVVIIKIMYDSNLYFPDFFIEFVYFASPRPASIIDFVILRPILLPVSLNNDTSR